jgi:peptidoglycan hydrolase CwlO-like protein
MTEPDLRPLAQRLLKSGVISATLAIVAASTLTTIVCSGPASGDQVSDLKAQAATIARDLVLEQLQIDAYQQQYDVDGAKVARDAIGIEATEHQISADTGRVGRDRKRLESEAVSAYINLDPQSEGTQVLFEGNQTDAFARAEYEDVTTGDANLTIAALRTDENGLNAQRAVLVQQEAQDQAVANQQAAQANAARQTQVELSSKQSEITGQLAVAVAQQQAAQASAAAKAVRAAQTAAAAASPSQPPAGGRSATSTTQPAGSTTRGTPAGASSGDPSLPPFLQCVLRVESGGNYNAISPGGAYMGGFQFSQPTWNEAAQLAGMPQLVNVAPNDATPAEQDDLAIALYDADGQQPWDDSCRNG